MSCLAKFWISMSNVIAMSYLTDIPLWTYWLISLGFIHTSNMLVCIRWSLLWILTGDSLMFLICRLTWTKVLLSWKIKFIMQLISICELCKRMPLPLIATYFNLWMLSIDKFLLNSEKGCCWIIFPFILLPALLV